MSLTINQLYNPNDYLIYQTESSGKTFYLLVKIKDVYRAEEIIGITPDPTVAPTLALNANAGSTLTAATYYVKYTWVTLSGETKVSPEASVVLTTGNNIVVTLPALPVGVVSANIYISTSTNTETKQGNTTTTTYTQSTSLVVGASVPASNTTPTYKIYYNAIAYDDAAYKISSTSPVYITMVVDEPSLMTMSTFTSLTSHL